tara:strand:- start:1113 stop:1805 length:693 start_codon:yes stop_codon:yes gene_type:complete
MINHEYKFIFLHIPKCAGTSVGQTLKEICTYGRWHAYACNGEHEEDPFNGHMVCREFGPERHFDTFDEQMYKDYFVFTFTRNPWDRMVSHYKFRHQDFGITQGFDYFVRNFNECFKEWTTENELESELIHTTSQIDFLRGNHEYECLSPQIDRTPYIDFYGKFENIEEDFQTIIDTVGIKTSSEFDGLWKINTSEYIIDDWRTMYTPELREYVAMKYSDDIQKFKYKYYE